MAYETRSGLLDARSVVIALVVLLLGAGLGFGVGYKYEQHRSGSSHTSASSNTPATSANSAGASSAAKVNEVLIACMAKLGVKYPSASADVSKPPSGVSQVTYENARGTCTKGLLKH